MTMSVAVPRNLHTKVHISAALALGLGAACAVVATDPAQACRGWRGWSTGEDVNKLREGEIAVKAKLIESYQGEQPFPSIMGIPYGKIYYVEISHVLGSHPAVKVDISETAKIHVRRSPSVCEAFSPRDFIPGAERLLVLKRGPTGLYDVVGGQES